MGLPAAKTKRYVTYDEYLALEAETDERYVWLDGEIWAAAEGTPTHSEIATNIVGLLFMRLQGKRCRPYNSDLRVRVAASGMAFRPDVTVVCGPREIDAQDATAVVNPTVLVEVLSRSTERYDRTEKLHHYRLIPSLRDYLLVSQVEARIEHYQRNEDGTWTLRDLGPGAAAHLAAIDVTLAVEDVYAGVDLTRVPPEAE